MVGNNKPRLAIAPGTIGHVAEVWVYRHAVGLDRYDAHVLTSSFINKNLFPYKNVHFIDNPNPWMHRIYQLELLFKERKFPRSTLLRSWRTKKILGGLCPDLVHCHFLWNAREFVELGVFENTPILVTAHGTDVNMARVNEKYRRSVMPVFQSATKIFAVSNFIAECLVKLGCPKDKIVTLYLGCPISESALEATEQVRSKINVVSTGSCIRAKGYRDLIEAFARATRKNPQLQLTIIGDGEERERLQRQIEESGLTRRIQITGFIASDQVTRILSNSDIYVQNSLPDEGEVPGFGPFLKEEALGIGLVEASAVGLPLIATRTGGVPEICRHAENGFLVEPYDCDGLAARISQLADDPLLRKRLGENGKVLVKREFDAEMQMVKLQDHYDQILGICTS